MVRKVPSAPDLHLGSPIDALPRSPRRLCRRRRPRHPQHHRTHQLQKLRAAHRPRILSKVRSRSLEQNLRTQRPVQHSRQLRPLLHCLSRPVCRHHVCRTPLRLQLSKSRAAATLYALRYRRDRRQQRSAFSFSLSTAQRIGDQPRHLRQLGQLHSHRRRPLLLLPQPRALHQRLHVLNPASDQRAHSVDRELRRQSGAPHPHPRLCKSRRPRAMPQPPRLWPLRRRLHLHQQQRANSAGNSCRSRPQLR